ncbi:S41 family peptidase [Mucilaginibacter sp. UR6-11]|uniref:S41 family peptidase n=1 Tax=Mucilaginibacter sp. UR6-11 TaxID=1435644 RepID=UPI001E594A8D|nr:S41 family peptidase [Mucilaginibacter sp. UR6-11]MCC8425112.1 peptidase S41 [Mucilaginibacter sp. UR6-11]
MKKFSLIILLIGFVACRCFAQSHVLWMQQPAISPDGNWIAFEYKGNIFKVAATGGSAIPLTINSSYNGYPVWSHDGKTIAFASDRYGNFDVYTMPADGGAAKRLTFDSGRDIPNEFSADDQTIYFGGRRHDIASSVRFPEDGYFTKLYKVATKGGRSFMVNAAGTEFVHFNKAGDKFIFQDSKGYENPYRKHHTSAITRDIWIYNTKTNVYTKVSDYKGEDREPLWGNGGTFYYLSERNGNQNLFRATEANPGKVTQLTTFDKNPVRNLSRAENGTFAFTQNGEIYTLKEGQKPQKISISINADFNGDQTQNIAVRGGASEMAVSPDGKEIAFVYRGEIFAAAAEGGLVKRITNTPNQERMIKFSLDGRSIIYSVENEQSWDIYKITIANKSEPYFYAATTLTTEPVIATDKDEFQPIPSPDGKKIAYLEERNVIKVYDIAAKKSIAILPEDVNFSYADGDQNFVWSADSKYILAQSSEGNALGAAEIVLIKADGSKARVNLTQSGFDDNNPHFGMGDKMMYWTSDKQGMKNLTRGGQGDVFAMFFDQAAWDRFLLNKEDLAIKTEIEKRDSVDIKKAIAKADSLAKAQKKKITPPAIPEFSPNLENLEDRTVRLTLASSRIGDSQLSKDGEKLYYLARFDKGYNLWVLTTRTKESRILAEINANGGSLEMSKDGRALFLLSGGGIMRIGVDDGKVTPVPINTTFTLNAAAERAYIYEHVWKQVKKKLFDPNLQGVDWNYYHDTYARFLPYISNNYDFQVLLSELLGELNVSHTGGIYAVSFPDGERTAALGLLYDYSRTGDGLLVKDIITGGPFSIAKTKMKRGYIIDKIDGTAITADEDWAKLLNSKANKFTLITFHDPATHTTYNETVKPITIGAENGMLYDRWVRKMEHLTDSLSHGEVGYVHIAEMNEESYRSAFDKVLGKNINKKALIVDTRFNGGGWLHDDLVTFLGGKRYFSLRPQGHVTTGGESANKWDKPSCVLMSEGNYSDAFMFPYAYKELGLGKLIGMPVAGTGTAVWWENQIDNSIIFGIPMISSWGTNETHPTENHELEPDIKVNNDYNQELSGEDQQLEAAVKEMLKEVGGK